MKYVLESGVRREAVLAVKLARIYRSEGRKGDCAADRIGSAYRQCFLGLLRVLKNQAGRLTID